GRPSAPGRFQCCRPNSSAAQLAGSLFFRTGGRTRMVRMGPRLLLLPLMFSPSGPKGATQPHVPSSQETYEYAICPKGGDDCPRERTLACALQTIASGYNACSQSKDCVAAHVAAKCSDAGSCPPLYVNREMRAAFEAEAQERSTGIAKTRPAKAVGCAGSPSSR